MFRRHSPARARTTSAIAHTPADTAASPPASATAAAAGPSDPAQAATAALRDMRGRQRSPGSWATASAPAALRSSTPPSYARHSLDRSPLPNPLALDDRPRVPPPIYLRSSSPQSQSKLGTLKIQVPSWGVALVRPPRQYDLHPLESGSTEREPPAEDTVLTGALEVVMKERRRVQAISVGVQSVCKLNMGAKRGWEDDGVFERGVEVLSGDAEGIWLEKGSQSFSFSILLPATLATYDRHAFGRVSYILTARVEGISDGVGGIHSLFKSKEITPQGAIPFISDFHSVIARSDKIAQDLASGKVSSHDFLPTRTLSRDSAIIGSPGSTGGGGAASSLSPHMSTLGLSGTDSALDDDAIAVGDHSPPVRGLYHRRQSSDMNAYPRGSVGPGGTTSSAGAVGSPLGRAPSSDTRSIISRASLGSSSGGDPSVRSEKSGWLKGDICAVRLLKIHANPSPNGGVFQLDLRKEGFVAGLGPWRFSATSDAFSISSVMLISLTISQPSPCCTIFFTRLLISQSYALYSPRTPNDPPFHPEAAKNHVLYQVGRPHQHGEKKLAHTVQSLWRGCAAGGKETTDAGWRTRAVVRLPNHDKIRPTTNPGTITPIRVTHELLLQIFYSVEGETVAGKPIAGPGEVRMCQIKLPITVPSCCCSTAALNLPTYADAAESGTTAIDQVYNEPNFKAMCACGASFAELGEAAMRRAQTNEGDVAEEEWARSSSTRRGGTGGSSDRRSSAAAGGPGSNVGSGSSAMMGRSASERGKRREAGEED